VEAARKRAIAPLNRESGENPYLLHEDLQQIMHDNVNIVREGPNLQKAIDDLEALKVKVANIKAHGSSQFNPGWHEALSMSSLMITAEMVARAAHIRQESRGAHTRLDFEGENKEWEKYELVISLGEDGNMVLDKRERKAAPPELEAIARATLEELEGKQ
jgi:succinate dehydrogenase / fumarate reductase flavoprotein subunit